MDEKGNALAVGHAGASNPVRVEFEHAIAAIRAAAEITMSEARVTRGAIAGVCAGIAGTGNAEAKERMRSELAAVFPEATVMVCTDLEIALAAAGDGPVILLIAGTGSAAIGRDAEGRVERAGGLGFRAGDEGSAGDIGKRATMTARAQREHEGGETRLGKQLLRQIGSANWNAFERELLVNGDEIYPRFFPVVANAADTGDDVARQLLRDAAEELTTPVRALKDKLGLEGTRFRVVKTGGMVGRCTFFDTELDARLREAAPNAEIEILSSSPAHAAARIALKLVANEKSGDLHG